MIFGFAVLFDVSNGANDISGIIAAPVATGALRPLPARLVVLAGVFIGPFLARAAVARAYSSGLVRLPSAPQEIRLALLVLLLSLAGATAWNFLARWRAWPTSSSHALVGALIGAALVALMHQHAVHWGAEEIAKGQLAGFIKTLVALLASPALGLGSGWLFRRLLRLLLRRADFRIGIYLKMVQQLLLFVQGLSYGLNDAQKTMGILTAAVMVSTPAGQAVFSKDGIPDVLWWVRLISVASVSVGAMIGSGKILRKLGQGVFALRTSEGLAAQAGATTIILGMSMLGGPVSSTQVLASAIVGSGAATRKRAVHWSAAASLVAAWVITIPGAALLTAAMMFVVRGIMRLVGLV